jgi:hypothetical protein
MMAVSPDIEGEPLADVIDYRLWSGRGECEYRRTAGANRVTKRPIRGSKVVPPLTDTVRFVDDVQIDRPRRERVGEVGLRQLLRRTEDELGAPILERPLCY